jgi:release factor glutamine methyltransferase
MMTLGETESKFIDQLASLYNQAEAKSIAWWCISHVCKISKSSFLATKNEELSAENESSLNLILEELKTGKPVQYVLGETEFYGLPFKVNPAVLIPRPETEELVDWVLIELRNRINAAAISITKKNENSSTDDSILEELTLERIIEADQTIKILDLGTGSGCIPIAIKKYLPHVEVSALDISEEAIKTAIENARLNSVSVNFFKDDILNMSEISTLNTQYSILISNPPYVTISEKDGMHKNVLEHEPHAALFVPDNDALIFYHRIAEFAKAHLVKQGLLFLEINENLGPKTVELLNEKGFVDIELRQDMRGKNRMIRATL